MLKNKTMLSVPFDTEKLPALTAYAKKVKKSRSAVIREAVAEFMDKVKGVKNERD